MPSREEIREGIKESIAWAMTEPRCFELGILARAIEKATEMVYKKLHSQGVVIKVDCPECGGDGRTDKHLDRCFSNRCYKCNGYGYKAVEPLIKEK